MLTRIAVLSFLFAAPALAQTPLAAEAAVVNRQGDMIGTVYLEAMPSGVVSATLALTDLPAGAHGVHLHQTGDCSAADFASAGGHIAGGMEHGVLRAGGPHPGDLPNIVAGAEGDAGVEFFLTRIDLGAHIFDADGAAFIVHAGADDYFTQPAGDAGDRIACGVFGPATVTTQVE